MKLIYHPEVWPFINSLQKPTRSKVLHHLELLKRYGPFLKMPHTKKIEGPLYELRVRGQQEIRLFYTFKTNNCLVLHGFIKKSQKTPRREIRTALNRLPSLT